jgi:hypothetical protein
MVDPTLIALVADRVPDADRTTALGVYRFFRDCGYALVIAGPGGMVAVVGAALVLATLAVWRVV